MAFVEVFQLNRGFLKPQQYKVSMYVYLTILAATRPAQQGGPWPIQ